jgi:hypothetical protein
MSSRNGKKLDAKELDAKELDGKDLDSISEIKWLCHSEPL